MLSKGADNGGAADDELAVAAHRSGVHVDEIDRELARRHSIPLPSDRALLLILRDIPTAYQGIAELSSLLPADMSTSISVATSKKLQNTLAFFSAKLKKRLPGRKMPEDIKPFVRQLLPAHRQKHRSFKPGLTRGYPSVDELLFVVDLITHYLKQRSTELDDEECEWLSATWAWLWIALYLHDTIISAMSDTPVPENTDASTSTARGASQEEDEQGDGGSGLGGEQTDNTQVRDQSAALMQELRDLQAAVSAAQSELDRLQSAVREEQAASAAEIARLQAATREARLAADQRIAEHKARADVRVSEAESAAVARIDSVLAQVNEELIVMIRVAQRQAAEHAASKAKREFQLAQARLVDTQQQLRIEEQVLASKRQDFEEARAQVQALEQQVSQAQQMLQAVQQVLQAPQPQAQPMAE